MLKASKLIQRIYLVCCHTDDHMNKRIANWLQQPAEYAININNRESANRKSHFFSQTMIEHIFLEE